MQTLAERIRWLIEHRAPLDRGRRSARALSLKAGLSGGHVGNILTRLKHNPQADIERKTLEALARAAEVSLEWLARGEGSALCARPGVDPAPSRGIAAQRAASEGVWHEAIRSVVAEDVDQRDAERSVDWWLLRMRLREIEMIDEARRRDRAASARALPGAPTPAAGTLRVPLLEPPPSSDAVVRSSSKRPRRRPAIK